MKRFAAVIVGICIVLITALPLFAEEQTTTANSALSALNETDVALSDVGENEDIFPISDAQPDMVEEQTAASDAQSEEIENNVSDGRIYLGERYYYTAPSDYNLKLGYAIKPDGTIVILNSYCANYDNYQHVNGFYVPDEINGVPVTEISSLRKYRVDNEGAELTYSYVWQFKMTSPIQVRLSQNLTAITTSIPFLPTPRDASSAEIVNTGSVGSVTLPNTLAQCAERAFSGIYVIGDFTFSSAMKQIEKGTLEYSEITGDVIVPSGVETIADSAFKNTKIGGTVRLPNTLKTIENYAFSDTSLTSVYIPSSVISIDDEAFTANSFTIYGVSGSCAQQYAQKKGYNFVDSGAQIAAFVERLYTVALNRGSDAGGKADWINRLKTGKATAAEVVRGFIMSPEFEKRGLSNADAVETLYKAMLNRGSDAVGKADWINALENGMSFEAIVAGFANSNEFATLCSSYGVTKGDFTTSQPRDKNRQLTAFVSRLYSKLLQRSGDAIGLNDWCSRIIKKAETPNQVAHGFVFSDEFIGENLSNDEFVTRMYRTFLGREPDPAGKADWLNRLKQGQTKEQIFNGFADSQEFAGIIASFGL